MGAQPCAGVTWGGRCSGGGYRLWPLQDVGFVGQWVRDALMLSAIAPAAGDPRGPSSETRSPARFPFSRVFPSQALPQPLSGFGELIALCRGSITPRNGSLWSFPPNPQHQCLGWCFPAACAVPMLWGLLLILWDELWLHRQHPAHLGLRSRLGVTAAGLLGRPVVYLPSGLR